MTAVDVESRRERQLISLKRRLQMLGVKEKRHSALKDRQKEKMTRFAGRETRVGMDCDLISRHFSSPRVATTEDDRIRQQKGLSVALATEDSAINDFIHESRQRNIDSFQFSWMTSKATSNRLSDACCGRSDRCRDSLCLHGDFGTGVQITRSES